MCIRDRCYPGGTAGFSQKAWELRVPSTAVLVFFAGAAGAGVVPPDLLHPAGLLFHGAVAADALAGGLGHPLALDFLVLLDAHGVEPVSYTHLDVYKRQMPSRSAVAEMQ